VNISPLVVVERELVRLGRRWQTMASRAGFAAMVFLFVGSIYIAQQAAQSLISVTALAQIGRAVFLTWAGSLFGAVILITPVLVGQAVLDEKEDRTLELLAITRLTPRRILWGTLLSRLVMVESLMLAAAPVLAVVLSFGGVGPMEMLNVLVQANVTMVVVGAVATFCALYSRSVILVALQTWGWLFMANLVSGMLAGIGTLGGTGLMLATPWMAFSGVAAQTGLSPWMALVVPTLNWGCITAAVMHVTVLCFETLALGDKETSQRDADLSSGFWRLEAFRRKLWPAGFALIFLSPLLFAPKLLSAVPVVPYILMWGWFTAVMCVGGVMHLMGVRKGALKRGAAAARAQRRSGWRRLSSHFDKEDRYDKEAQGGSRGPEAGTVAGAFAGRTRRRRLLSPDQRRVWDFPIVWRETVTAAHGRVRRALFVWYALIAFVVVMAAGLGGFEDRGVPMLLGGWSLGWVPLLTLLLATSSVVGERRAGTLELLCVTPLSGSRIVWGKLGSLALLIGPGFVIGGGLLMLGTIGRNTPPALPVALGLLWFGVINVVIALMSMWRALSVKTPSRAWVANLMTIGLLGWVLSVVTGALSVAKPLLAAWSIVVPFGMAAYNEDLLPLALLGSSLLWGLYGLVLMSACAQRFSRRAADG